MNQTSTGLLVEDQGDTVSTPVAGRRTLIWTAWIATLLLSNLPLVIARDVLGGDIPWIAPAWIAAAALLVGASYFWQMLRPLRGYFAVMGLIVLMSFIITPSITQTSAWDSLVGGRPEIVAVFGYRVLLTIQTLVVLGILLLSGMSRREVFLTIGDLRAPARGIRLPGRKEPVSWLAFGVTMAVLLGGLFFLFLASQNPEALADFSVVLPWLPLVLLSAGLNAFGEEGLYRAAPLSRLLPSVGGRHALWMTSIWFGLGHYYGGIPSGPIGAIQSGLVGLLMGKAMLDTRGMAWPWIIHVVLDTVIYIFIAATMG